MQKKIKHKEKYIKSAFHSFHCKRKEKQTENNFKKTNKQIIPIFSLVLISNKQVQLDIDTLNLVIPMTFDQDQFVLLVHYYS
jgi:hypothetical protein